MQSHIGYSCFTFLHCGFSIESSTHMPEMMLSPTKNMFFVGLPKSVENKDFVPLLPISGICGPCGTGGPCGPDGPGSPCGPGGPRGPDGSRGPVAMVVCHPRGPVDTYGPDSTCGPDSPY